MKNTLNFLIEVGKLKKMPRRGWILRGMKNPETIAAHTFRMVLMAWLLGKQKKLNVSKILKMSLIHDLCEVYAGDTTPHDNFFLKNKKKFKKITLKWPRLSKRDKEKIFREKYEKECKSLKKLILKLPLDFKKEIKDLWMDYEKGLTREGKFVRQLDRVESLLQAMEYLRENKNFSIESFWVQVEELVDDPILLEFINSLEKRFHRK